jgi:hypothetical protein
MELVSFRFEAGGAVLLTFTLFDQLQRRGCFKGAVELVLHARLVKPFLHFYQQIRDSPGAATHILNVHMIGWESEYIVAFTSL